MIMDKGLLSQLESLHLSPNEAKVYLALLETGQTSAGELIKKTGLHRSVVYETLDKLITKELVFSLNKEKISFFQPTDPTKFIEQVKSQQLLAELLVPKLKQLSSNQWPEINIYEGIEAYRRFWIKMVSEPPVGTIDYVAGSIGPLFYEHMGEMLPVYMEAAVKRKIKWQVIAFDKKNAHADILEKYPGMREEIRLLQRDIPPDGNFNIIGDTLVLHSATEPMVIEIKNKVLVKVFQNLFSILWEQAKPMK